MDANGYSWFAYRVLADLGLLPLIGGVLAVSLVMAAAKFFYRR